MAIYAENEGTIELEGLTDAAGDPVLGATATAYLLRGETEVWTGAMTDDGAGDYSAVVPDTLELTVGEILTERVEVESGTVNAVYTNQRRVRTRRG